MSVASATALHGVPTGTVGTLSTYSDVLVSFGITVLTFVVAFVLLYQIGKSVLVRLTKQALDARDFPSAVVSLGSSIAVAIAFFGAIGIAATVADFPTILAAFATIAAALALGLAFAASDIIENFVAGIFIIKDKPFEVGDYIEWNGNGGIVRDIDLRVTKLDTFDNEQLTVPNGDLAGSVVKNPVANDTRRVSFDFGIDYEADIEHARSIILEEGSAIEGVLDDPAPTAPVTGLEDSAVVLNGRLWIDPSETGAGGVKTTFVEAVKLRFDEEDVGMPYPYTELTGSVAVDSIENPAGAVSDD